MEFTNDMKIIATVLGDEAAMKLMKEAGGVNTYIPKPNNRDLVVEHLKENGFNTKLVAVLLNLSQRTVDRVLQEYKQEQKEKQNRLNRGKYRPTRGQPEKTRKFRDRKMRIGTMLRGYFQKRNCKVFPVSFILGVEFFRDHTENCNSSVPKR